MSMPQTRSQSAAPSVAGLLLQSKEQIAAALPKHVSPDRMSRMALTEIRKNQALARCDPYSFIGALIQCSQLGLEPGSGLGHAYLIPFKNQVQLVVGYQGMIDLALRSGKVDSIYADVVYIGDEFDYFVKNGVQELYHKPGWKDRKAENITHVYAIAQIKNGGYVVEVMSADEVAQIEQENRKGSNMSLVWQKYWSEMAKKTVIRRIYKKLPKSVEMADAFSFTNVEHEAPNLRKLAEEVLPDVPPLPAEPVGKGIDDLTAEA